MLLIKEYFLNSLIPFVVIIIMRSFKRSTNAASPIRKRARVSRRTYSCNSCIRTFGRYKDLQNHARSHARQQSTVNEDMHQQDVSNNSSTDTSETDVNSGQIDESIDGNYPHS